MLNRLIQTIVGEILAEVPLDYKWARSRNLEEPAEMLRRILAKRLCGLSVVMVTPATTHPSKIDVRGEKDGSV